MCVYYVHDIVCVCVAVMAILTQTTWNVFKKNWQLREWLRQTWPTGREISFKTQENTLNIHSRISVTISTSQKVLKLLFSFAVHQIRLLVSVTAGRLPILKVIWSFFQELSLFVCLCSYYQSAMQSVWVSIAKVRLSQSGLKVWVNVCGSGIF